MSEVKVNKITPTTNCGTVTLGDSGDTVAIPCGVTLSNSGSITNSGTITNTGTISGGTITGTIDNQVNWDTTAKTAGFTAVAGNGYFVNTTSGAITVTLPATPSAGDLVGIKDYANTANTNNITIDRNGSNIQGTANNFIISVAGTSITLIYVDGTQGWVSTGAAKASDIAEQQLFVTATGGTITTCGDFKIHTFTGPGTFCVSCAGTAPGSNKIDYLVIAGGGGGGSSYVGAGGGAGGHRTTFPSPGCNAGAFPISVAPYPITVGGGGSAAINGSDSIFSTITSTGGGRGGPFFGAAGNPGGSGGGGGSADGSPSSLLSNAGTGNTPPVSPSQGNNGGNGWRNTSVNGGGGGGGAGATGSNGAPAVGGNGGSGSTNSINGSATTRAGGGGGGAATSGTGGSGGSGGGGAGKGISANGDAGSTNTGSGGGGSGYSGAGVYNGGAGGSGIVVIRYKYQ
jgi:hypothetical protein